jgi:SiaC family regulatory phosphoprotein
MILTGNHENTLPHINYDEIAGSVYIKGRSISAEVDEYFKDFLTYLHECTDKNPINFNATIDLEYFNTKSARLLLEFFEIIKENIALKGKAANITWVIEEEDESMKEAAEDYESIVGLDFIYEAKSV